MHFILGPREYVKIVCSFANNLQKKRGWPHQEHWVLCDGPLETGLHLSFLCPFGKAVWHQVLSWEHFGAQHTQSLPDPLHICTWWEKAAGKVPKAEKRRFNGMFDLHILEPPERKKQTNFQQHFRVGVAGCFKS